MCILTYIVILTYKHATNGSTHFSMRTPSNNNYLLDCRLPFSLVETTHSSLLDGSSTVPCRFYDLRKQPIELIKKNNYLEYESKNRVLRFHDILFS